MIIHEILAVIVQCPDGESFRATLHSGGLIKTAVPISLPAPMWVNQSDAFNVSQLTVPVLFLGGREEPLLAIHAGRSLAVALATDC